MPRNFQNTNYQGAVVSKQLATALKAHPIGRELLRFDAQGEQTVMQVRLPEKGRYVLLQIGENTYRRTFVEVQSVDERNLRVLKGLNIGDVIITEGAFYLIDKH